MAKRWWFAVVCLVVCAMPVWAARPASAATGEASQQKDPPPPKQAGQGGGGDKTGQEKLANDLTTEANRLRGKGKHAESEKLFRQALEIRKKLFGEESGPAANSYNSLGSALNSQGKIAEAEKAHRRGLEIRLKLYGESHTSSAGSFYALGQDLAALGKHADAESAFRKSAEARTKLLGPEDDATVDTLNLLANALSAQKKLVEAEELYRKTLEIRKRRSGAGDPRTAQSNNNLGFLLAEKGQHAEAIPYFRQAIEIYSKSLGEDHLATANTCQNLASSLEARHEYAEAEQLLRKALAIKSKLPEKRTAALATLYSNLANAVDARGRYAEAEPFHRKALALCTELSGPEHSETVKCYHRLAQNLRLQGQFAEAVQLSRKAVDVCQRVHGEDQLLTAVSYDNLASMLGEEGKNSDAEIWYRKALAIWLTKSGEESDGTAIVYGNLAACLESQGRFAEAEQLNRKVLALHLKQYGEWNDSTAKSYNNLGTNLSKQNLYREAEQALARALVISRKIRGDRHPETATIYNNLASVLRNQGNPEAAEKMSRKALEIRRQTFGEQHLSTANSYGNLGSDLQALGRFAEAEKADRAALEIFRTIMGEQYEGTCTAYNNLALKLSLQGKFAEAEKLLRKALSISREVRGEEHPMTATCYDNLAQSLYFQGDFDQAERFALAWAASFQKARVRVSFTGLGRSSFSAKKSALAFLAVLLARNGKADLAWKYLEDDLGRGLFDELSARAARKLTPEEHLTEETLQGHLAYIEKQLSAATKSDLRKSELLTQQRQATDKLVEFQAAMEKKYGAAVGQVYGLDRIRAALPADVALIAWVDIKNTPNAKILGGDHWGVVVRREGPPAWVEIKGSGPEGSWEEKDAKLSGKVLAVLQNPDPATDWSAWTADLARQRLRPLKEHLEGINHLIILPSTGMAGIPVEAITDRYQISYAPSATVYAWLRENSKDFRQGSASLLALADPIFSREQAEKAARRTTEVAARRGGDLKPLPGTRGEVEAISSLFGSGQVAKFLGADANSSNLERLAAQKKLASFRFLHLATHGQFDAQGGMNSYLCLTSENLAQAPFDKLSAGQILRTWKLDAELVTFSACLSARGQLQGGEGYVGFSQALFLAGAHSVLLSQWPVNDWSTTLLMERFYQNLLGKREGLQQPMSKVEALTEARQWLRELSRAEAVSRLKAQGIPADAASLAGERPFEHPCYWAPFILIGDPGPSHGSPKQ